MSAKGASGAGGKAAAEAAEEKRDELGRRVWDKDAFEAQAKERARAAEAAADTSKRGSILAVKRELLKGRETKVDLASRLGKSRAVESAHSAASGYHCKVVLTQDPTNPSNQPQMLLFDPTSVSVQPFRSCVVLIGWVCDCVLRDSINYLDHINGKKHQRNLGMSMRVERSTLDQVKERLAARKRQIEVVKKGPEEYDLDARVAALQEEEEERLRQKKEAKRRKKEEDRERSRREKEEQQDEMGGQDDDMAALMGFGGFGTSKK